MLEPVTDEELESCPFCEGREDRTPPEVLAVSPAPREPNAPGWSVRVVPNKYPAFDRQEVVVHTPRHVRSVAELDAAQFELVADVWRDREAVARAEGYELFACVNEGRTAGASLPHSHSQLVWLHEEPPLARLERGDRCKLCDYLDRECAEGTRVVEKRVGLVLLCPYASRSPYECLVAPLAHEPGGFASALLGVALELAAEALRRLAAAEGPRPMNLWLHESGHWHLELVPRMTVFAGLELGAGIYINTLAPEDAARRLREAPVE